QPSTVSIVSLALKMVKALRFTFNKSAWVIFNFLSFCAIFYFLPTNTNNISLIVIFVDNYDAKIKSIVNF
ncbi:hypothetical protein CSC82_28485, partial [Rhodobacteraceae bacterium 4F10]